MFQLKQVKARSAGVVVVRREGQDWRYLLLRAYKNWDFPKGGVEAGETQWNAACREVKEEAGITDLHFRWGQSYWETPPYAHGKVARYYLAETRMRAIVLPVNPWLGRPEHHAWRWVNFATGFAILHPRLQEVLTWAADVLARSD